MCMCVYTYTCIYVHMYNICIHECVDESAYGSFMIQFQRYTFLHVHVYMRVHIMCMYMCTCTYTYVHIHIYIYIYMYICIHECVEESA